MSSLPSTRRSTATEDSAFLPTPFDDIPLRHDPKSSGFAAQDGVRVYSPSSTAPSQSAFRSYRGDGEGQTPTDGPHTYFAQGPPRHGEAAPQLSRRGTTKELIGRFEALDTSSAGPHTPKRLSVRRDSFSMRGDVGAEQKDKARSPIRQSFRNLLSVFRKNKPPPLQQAEMHVREEEPTPPPPPQQPVEARERALPPRPTPAQWNRNSRGGGERPFRRPAHVPLTLQIPAPLAKPTPEDRTVCTTPISAHTGKAGPLLYLSSIPDANIPPVWMSCTGQLHSTHVLVTWETPQGNPSPKLVPFTACTDVRSLSPMDLDEPERGLLPDDPEWKVFELLFEGRPRERFAARSLTERATWVSAIWDAVLQAQENRIRSPASESVYTPLSMRAPSMRSAEPYSPSTGKPAHEGPSTYPPRVSAFSREQPSTRIEKPAPDLPVSSRGSNMSTASANRELPPIPSESGPRRPPALKLDLRNLSESALASLPAPPTTPSSVRSSFLSPSRLESPTRAPSPSIRNLDQRSVVTQRLAQIEGTSSRPQSPVSPTKLRQGYDSPLALRRQASSVSTSIVNSYLGSDVGSPLSERSGGLTTLASRLGSPPPRMSAFSGRHESSRLLPPKNDSALLSPASDYSADNEETGTAGPQSFRAVQTLTVPPPPSSGGIVQAGEVQPIVTKDDTVNPLLQDIRQGLEGLQGRSATAATNIVSIRTKVDEVLEELRRRPEVGQDGDAPGPVVLEKLEALQTEIRGHLSELQTTVEVLKESTGNNAPARQTTGLPGIAALHEKLDHLMQRGRAGDTGEQGGQIMPADLAEVMALLKDAEEQRASQLEQQTDSIRYLNELNTWLEAFVKHGTSQIEGVAAGVQQLCRDLGSLAEPQNDAAASRGGETQPQSTNLLSDIRRLLIENKEREQNTSDLHASVNGLIATVQEDLRHSAETRNILTTESVMGVIDRQHHDQEQLLKVLATELTNEIRGERLRFVEAMKEATAINVQIHVEQFKKELTREVVLMTQEVTKLQRERQGLEQQIADLFAFYAKQKQSVKMGGPARAHPLRQPQPMVQPNLNIMPGGMASMQSVYRRPLPSPVSGPGPMRAQ